MRFELDLPADVFDAEFREPDFAARLRELAILELIRIKRLHEHEAQEMLSLERWQLVELMERNGITPTEKVFSTIKSELESAIASSRKKRSNRGSQK